MFDRAQNICSSALSRRKEEKTLLDIFSKNGYSTEFIKKSSKNAPRSGELPSGEPGSSDPATDVTRQAIQTNLLSETGLSSNVPPSPGSIQPTAQSSSSEPVVQPGSNKPHGSQSSNNRPRYVSMPYIKGVSEPISRFLRAHNVIVGHSSRTLKKSLVHLKDRIPKDKQKGVVYELRCDCGELYIGETGRPRDVRLNEHKSDIQHGRVQKSAPARHARECDRQIHTMEAKTLTCESNWRKRTVREAIEIKEKDPFMNRDVGKFALSPIWDFTLRKAT